MKDLLVRELHQLREESNKNQRKFVSFADEKNSGEGIGIIKRYHFTFRVERYIHLGTYYKIADPQHGMKEATMMKLLMAIVPEEISSRVLSTLGAHGYRATLISTTGGFLRRGGDFCPRRRKICAGVNRASS